MLSRLCPLPLRALVLASSLAWLGCDHGTPGADGGPTCSDALKNGDETDVDCGGSCGPCAVGRACVTPLDCLTGTCVSNACADPSCRDGVKDGTESDVDCGGSCPACPVGGTCAAPSDCQSDACTAGRCSGCTGVAGCPGQDTECQTRTCTRGACGFSYADAGVRLAAQTAGDCQVAACNGMGASTSLADDTDLPIDANPCTQDRCTAGVPSHPALDAGTSCATDGGVLCDATAQCVGCLSLTDCPGQDTECQARSCTAGVCGLTFTASGTPTAAQTPGDCHLTRCDGQGATTSAVDDTDLPVDANPCTVAACSNGTPSNPPLDAGVACGADGGLRCDGVGACVQCLSPTDCAGQDTGCQARTCAGGACGLAFADAGLATSAQVSGDCRQSQCDGLGLVISVPLDTDLPVDGRQCTLDVCTAGTPSNPPATAGAVCSQSGGTMCDFSGTCVQCLVPSDCPGQDNECQVRACSPTGIPGIPSGVCGFAYYPAGTRLTVQVPGDCHTSQCDGAGHVVRVIDNFDVPYDGNQCTYDLCANGLPANPPVPSGTTCSQGGGVVCNASNSRCECLAASTCPGQDTECQARSCTAGACGFTFTPAGTATAAQTSGDCQRNQCNGAGGLVSVADDTDLPVDGNQCTSDLCTAGAPSNPALPARSGCAQGGGTLCDGAGQCVQCLAGSDCAGSDTDCSTRTCAANTCGVTFAPGGTVTATQTAGDCHTLQCDGAGGVNAVVDDLDLPVDGTLCTTDLCTAGVPSHAPASLGASCSDSGGLVCDGAGTCSDLVLVVRVGDGAAALSSAATAAFVEQRLAAGGALLTTLALPTAASGANARLTLAGSSTSEGALCRSANGSYVTLAGYDAAPGLAAVAGTASAATNRVVGRIDALGTVDTSTASTSAYSAGNVRGAVTGDGSGFWLTGSNGGVQYAAFATIGASTQLTAAPLNTRVAGIFGGQLYGTSGSAGFTNVYAVGAGLPTTAGQTSVALPGLPVSAASPYAFALFDRSPAVPGVDTLYVADDRSAATGGGVQKWTFDGATWTLAATFTGALTVGVRGLAAAESDGGVLLVATTTDNRLVRLVDDGSPAPAAAVLATAPANTAFRGVAFAPR